MTFMPRSNLVGILCLLSGSLVLFPQRLQAESIEAKLAVLEVAGCELEPVVDCTGISPTALKYKDLTGIPLQGAILNGLSFHGSSLRGADLRGASLQNTEFDMGSLEEADLRGADLTGTYLTLSRIAEADLREAILHDVNLSHATGSQSVQLQGASLCNTTLPDGSLRDDDC